MAKRRNTRRSRGGGCRFSKTKGSSPNCNRNNSTKKGKKFSNLKVENLLTLNENDFSKYRTWQQAEIKKAEREYKALSASYKNTRKEMNKVWGAQLEVTNENLNALLIP